MPNRIGGPKGPPKPTTADSKPASKPAAKEPKPAARPKDEFAGKKPSADKLFPRAGWQDAQALSRAVERSRAAVTGAKKVHPRVAHASRSKPGTKPVVVARYGLPTVNPGKPGKPSKPGTKPVVVARYGLPTVNPGGGGGTKPVVVARYGLPTVNPGKPGGTRPGTKPGGTKPVVVARYGLPTVNPGGGNGGGTKPVVIARYGLATATKR